MSRPPKIPNLLPLDHETIYFLTLCVQSRRPVLNNMETWNACLDVASKMDRWHVLALILMPDHLHALVSPYDRDLSVNDFSHWFKKGMISKLKPTWKWQRGSFDRLLRTDESAAQKWEYMRYNPVRAELVKSVNEWPYQKGL
ncbi:MAG: hypothetical protein B9S32_12005 [Verrucomicrobia bacterium Tous-C9LFEB]|nr:MAG: hypothetical protein B9S32_12005 [Verrucomicrobia bacterium Tous-C9LFEB]